MKPQFLVYLIKIINKSSCIYSHFVIKIDHSSAFFQEGLLIVIGDILMMQINVLNAQRRDQSGKGHSRAIRREGRIPAVIYGDNSLPEHITLDIRMTNRILASGKFMSSLYDLTIDDKVLRVLPREVQMHPVTDQPMHVDFLRIAKDGMITIAVPVSFINQATSPGIKRGGVLNIVHHDIVMRCPADLVPNSLEINLAGLDIGASIHIDAITMPVGAKLVGYDKGFTVATISAPTTDTAAATATPEAKPAAKK